MHQPVMVNEAMEGLDVKAQGIYIDGTFGRGGHAAAVLAKLGDQGVLHVYDRDPQAIKTAHDLASRDSRVVVHDAANSAMVDDMQQAGLDGRIDGILLDLGVSSPQLDEAARGFSFMNDGPLDMRMDPRHGEPVSAWLNRASAEEIADVLFHYGQERFSRRIAAAVVERRANSPWERTLELATTIAAVVPRRERHKHPATRTFLALRLWVNQESHHLQRVLEHAVSLLAVRGRLVVITFHSQEAVVTKKALEPFLPGNEAPGRYRMTPKAPPRLKRIGRVSPSLHEVGCNPRARSAVCRVWEKVA